MNELPTYLVRCVPMWVLEHVAFQGLVEHYMECDEKVLKYQVKPWYEGVFTVLDTHADDFVYVNKGRVKSKKIWKTRVFEEALQYVTEMNKEEPPKVYDEVALTQRIAHMNAHRRKAGNTSLPSARPFRRCSCGTMFRGEKHCG